MSAHDDLVAALTARAQALRAACAGLSLDLSSPGVVALVEERAGVPAPDAGRTAGLMAGARGAHDHDVIAALPGALCEASPVVSAAVGDPAQLEATVNDLLTTANADPTDPGPWCKLGLIRLMTGDLAGAAEAFGNGGGWAASVGLGSWAAILGLLAAHAFALSGDADSELAALNATAAACPGCPEVRLALAARGVPGQLEAALLIDPGTVLDAIVLGIGDVDTAAADALAQVASMGGAGSPWEASGWLASMWAWVGDALVAQEFPRPGIADPGAALAADGGEPRPGSSLAVLAAREAGLRKALATAVAPAEPEPSVPAAIPEPQRRHVDLPDPGILGVEGAQKELESREAAERRRYDAAMARYQRENAGWIEAKVAHDEWVAAGHIPGRLADVRSAVMDALARAEAIRAEITRPEPVPG